MEGWQAFVTGKPKFKMTPQELTYTPWHSYHKKGLAKKTPTSIMKQLLSMLRLTESHKPQSFKTSMPTEVIWATDCSSCAHSSVLFSVLSCCNCSASSQTIGQLFRPGPHPFIIAEDATAECLRYLAIGLAAAEGSLEAWAGPQLNLFQTKSEASLYSPSCKWYLLTWAGKWRMAGSNTWSIIQPLSVFIRSSVPWPQKPSLRR